MSNKGFPELKTFADTITQAFEAPAEPEHPAATRQMRYVHAAMAVAKLLRAGGEDESAERFHELAEALQDVAEGLPHPLFLVERPDAAGGRRRDTAAIWRTRAILCYGLEFLKAGGLDQDQAIAFALTEHRKALSKLLRPGAELRTSIAKWMKSFSTEEIQNEIALESYKKGLALLTASKADHTGAAIKMAGETIIQKAAERAARIP